MVIPEWVLKILVCPLQKEMGLRLMTPSEVKDINKRIEEKSLLTYGGRNITEPIESGLIREDGMVAYRIEKGIPILLPEEAIILKDQR